MTVTIDDAALKARHRTMWASGDYPRMVETFLLPLGPRLVDACDLEPGARVLDIAAGTGNAALRAARLGARVTALDLTPELFERGRERAAAAGVEIDWVEGDAEELPFEDGRFERVLSTFGIQFAPRHEVAAREALRVTRPGGAIGLINWTPQGLIGRILKAVGATLPKPPGYASPPPLWGDETHVDALFATEDVAIEHERTLNPFVGFGSPEEWVEFMASSYGPLLTARGKLEPAGAWQPLRDQIVAMTEAADRGVPGAMHVDSEYLLTLIRVA